MPPLQRYPQVPWLAQTSAPNLTFFCEPLLWIVSHQEMTIKHLMYMQLCAFMIEFRQPLQVQSHLEMPRILVQLGHTQRT